MSFRIWYWFGLMGLLVLIACERSPVTTSLLKDPAGLVKTSDRPRLAQLQQRLLKEFDIQLQVMILDRSPANLDHAAATLFDRYLFKNLSRGARGVLLLVDPHGGEVRMVTGYDLVEVFPRKFIDYIEERQMGPFFAEGRIAEGLTATLELLLGKAQGGMVAPDSPASPPVGSNPAVSNGSAVASVSSATVPGGAGQAAAFRPQPTPLAALAAFRQILASHNQDPDLELYTLESRQFLGRWRVSEAQQDNELRSIDRVLTEAEVIISGSLAVIRFPLEERRNAPYFLRRQQIGWQIDLAARNRLVRFNSRNQWHFNNLDHGFMFAFGDWQFDANGFPHRAVKKDY